MVGTARVPAPIGRFGIDERIIPTPPGGLSVDAAGPASRPAPGPGHPPGGEDPWGPDDDPAPPHDVRAVLRITAFRRLWLALGLSSFGDWLGLLATTALAKTLAEQLGGNTYTTANLAVAGVFILRLAPAVLLGPLAGALADRFNRRVTMVVGDLLRFALFVSIPLVGTLTWLFVATVLIECVALFWMPAKDATVPNLVPPHRLEAANQISLATTYGSAPLAAVVFSGLALLNEILNNYVPINPVDLALYFNALTFAVSAVTIAGLELPRRAQRQAAAGGGGVWRAIVEGWVYIGTTPVIRGLVLGMLGAFAAAGFVIGLSATYVADLGAGQPGFGVLFGSVFTGLAAGMWLGPRVLAGFSRRRLFGVALIFAGGFLVALALIPNIVMAVLFAAGLGACGGVAWVTGYTLIGLEVDDDVRGRTFGFLTSAARIVLVLVLAAGPALAGLIGRHTITFTENRSIDYNGAAFVFLLAAVIALVMGFTAYRQMDDRPGTGLLTDLRQAWSARGEQPQASAGRVHPGLFLALEGGDGAGKSTQARLLAEWLREQEGHEVVLTREPGATDVGATIRELVLGHPGVVVPRAEALLFAADRAQHVATVVRPALAGGSIVVTDRYTDSSVAYQGAGRNLAGDEIARLSRWATEGLLPDLTVLLDLDPAVAADRRRADATRAGADRMESQELTFHTRVRERFLDQARREPHRYLVLDAAAEADVIQTAIRIRVRQLLPLSARRRAELAERLSVEEEARRRRAGAEAQVQQIDAQLRARRSEQTKARREEAPDQP